jgi:hypothetical protein
MGGQDVVTSDYPALVETLRQLRITTYDRNIHIFYALRKNAHAEMSIRIMSAIWENGPESQGQLLVMLALSDYANDTGACWPSIASIARKARMTTRGTQKIIRQLEADGWLEIVTGNGRHGCNNYIVNPERSSPEPSSPPINLHTETLNLDTQTLNLDTQTLNLDTPEPSRTINEPSEVSIIAKPKFDPILASLCRVASTDAAKSFIEYRKKHKAKALSETAAKMLGNSLQEIFNAGHDPDDALGLAELSGWAKVNLEWYENAKGKTNERGNKPSQQSGKPTSAGRNSFLDEIAAAARS